MKIIKMPGIFRMLKGQGAFIKLISLLFLAIFLVACSKTTGSIVGSQLVSAEITRISELALDRNLTLEDLSKLRELTKNDKVAVGEFKEMDWLVAHNESDHAAHGMAFLNGYVQTGELTKCVAHEMQHIRLYLKYNDTGMVKDALGELDPQAWIDRSQSLMAKFPAYYKNFPQVKDAVLSSINSLKAMDYSDAVKKKLEFIENSAVC